MSVGIFNSTTALVTFDRAVLGFNGGPWTLQVLAGGQWRTSDTPTVNSGNTCRVTFGGATIASSNPWRLPTDNGVIGFNPQVPVSNPCQGAIL